MLVKSQNYRVLVKEEGYKYVFVSRYVHTFTGPTAGQHLPARNIGNGFVIKKQSGWEASGLFYFFFSHNSEFLKYFVISSSRRLTSMQWPLVVSSYVNKGFFFLVLFRL